MRLRKQVMALILVACPLMVSGLTLSGCESIQKAMAGPTKEKYAYDYAEAWLELKTIKDLTQTPQIEQQKYVRQLQTTKVEIQKYMAEYADRPEAQSESYRTLFEIIDHYQHAADIWRNRKGALLAIHQFEEAEDLMPKAKEAYQREYEQPLDEMVNQVNLKRIAAFEEERAKQEAAEKLKEEAKGSGHGGGHK